MLKSLRAWSIVLVGALVVTLIIAMPNLRGGQADAANAADFTAGHIISDENFYNGRAMASANEVQSFLQSKNAGCLTGKTCILNYTERTPTMAASAYCDRIEGRANESAASVIYRVGQACNISQKALIVLLEKEQSLVSLRDPASWRFTSATGYGCPDTAPCDAGFGGFFTQVYYGARAYQYYKKHPTQYRHIAGKWNSVLYNPSSSCGSSQVFIQNNATAGLYNYTPYQPNRAALNNLYGTGDSCSAYGNRNFWRLYTDWFGNPTGPSLSTGQVVQSSKTGDYFIYSQQQGMIRVPDRQHIVSLGLHLGVPKWFSNQIIAYGLSSTVVENWGLQCGSTRYFASTGKLQPFESNAVADHYGLKFTSLPTDVCNALPKSTNQVSQVATDLRGNLWVIDKGKKRPATAATLRGAKLDGKFRITLPTGYVNALPTGPAHTSSAVSLGDVVQSTRTNDYFIYSEQSGMIRVPDRNHLVSLGMHLNVAKMAPNDILAIGLSPTRLETWGIQCGSTRYFASTSRLQPFESGAVETRYNLKFATLPADVCGLLTVSQNRVSQVATDLQNRLWIIESGAKRPVSASALRAMNLDGKFRITLPTAYVESLPTRAAVTTREMLSVGGPVVDSDTGDRYVFSAEAGLVPMTDQAVAVSLDLHRRGTELPTSELQDIGFADVEVDSWLLQCADDGAYFASGGLLHPIASDTPIESFGLDLVQLPADVCGSLSTANVEVTQFGVDMDGTLWMIEDGAKREVTVDWLEEEGLGSEGLLTLPRPYADALPIVTAE